MSNSVSVGCYCLLYCSNNSCTACPVLIIGVAMCDYIMVELWHHHHYSQIILVYKLVEDICQWPGPGVMCDTPETLSVSQDSVVTI